MLIDLLYLKEGLFSWRVRFDFIQLSGSLQLSPVSYTWANDRYASEPIFRKACIYCWLRGGRK